MKALEMVGVKRNESHHSVFDQLAWKQVYALQDFHLFPLWTWWMLEHIILYKSLYTLYTTDNLIKATFVASKFSRLDNFTLMFQFNNSTRVTYSSVLSYKQHKKHNTKNLIYPNLFKQ